MPGTLVEKETCGSCGTEVRDGSVFCYNCGETVVTEAPPPPILKPATGSLNGSSSKNAKTLAFSDPEPTPILMPDRPPVIAEELSEKKTTMPGERVRRSRPVKKTQVPAEVEWVENSGSSWLFILGSVIFALIAAGFLAAAMYLK